MHAATNYIYIVFAILYIIYSIIKAAKKATQQKPAEKKPEPSSTVKPPTSSPLPQPGDDFKKMLEEVLGKVPEPKIPERHPDSYRDLKPEPIKIKPQPAKIVTHAKKVKATPSHPPSKIKEMPKPFLASEKEISKKPFTEESVPTEEQESDFDIRKAIIYSEILKRPQY
ncbi:MAG: OadG family protein [Bacteroidetes bacterium]|nr:OadG family protein [Bacteroidota bacterium]